MSLKKNRQTNKHSSCYGGNQNAAAPIASTLVSLWLFLLEPVPPTQGFVLA